MATEAALDRAGSAPGRYSGALLNKAMPCGGPAQLPDAPELLL